MLCKKFRFSEKINENAFFCIYRSYAAAVEIGAVEVAGQPRWTGLVAWMLDRQRTVRLYSALSAGLYPTWITPPVETALQGIPSRHAHQGLDVLD
jgi:hypothetical protein